MLIRGEADFYEILANSDVVIAATSTGMQEAIACDIPVIQVNFTGDPYLKAYDLSAFGWRKAVDDPIVMVNKVLSLLSSKKNCKEVIEKQKWLKNRMLKNFGNCGEVIAETIADIGKQERNGEGK
jgi:CDP-glycerol glycerophosphotransferase (TagB/SpsB family)